MLTHEYGKVLVERVWLVATERIPEPVAQLEAIMPRRLGEYPGHGNIRDTGIPGTQYHVPGEYPGHNTTFLKPWPDS